MKKVTLIIFISLLILDICIGQTCGPDKVPNKNYREVDFFGGSIIQNVVVKESIIDFPIWKLNEDEVFDSLKSMFENVAFQGKVRFGDDPIAFNLPDSIQLTIQTIDKRTFEKSIFYQPDFKKLDIKVNTSFIGSYFYENTVFDSTTFNDSLTMLNSIFCKSASFNKVQFGRSCDFKGSVVMYMENSYYLMHSYHQKLISLV